MRFAVTVHVFVVFAVFAGCGNPGGPAPSNPAAGEAASGVDRGSSVPAAAARPSLAEARRGFATKTTGEAPSGTPAPEPPPGVFCLVRYEAPPGTLAAYLTPDPGDGRKHPAIVWITGGDCNTIDELWEEAPRSNDQTAAAYRKAGLVMMLPSLRGGNDNPGRREGFFGEVDDILAAADYLARQDYVDPRRIYLGGHSTGGTLVLLVAEFTDRFRAVFSFGPTADVGGYDPSYLPFDTSSDQEMALRSPGLWLHSVRCPLFVFEGVDSPGNIRSLRALSKVSTNPLIHFLPVAGVDHFSILAPTNELIAARILRDDGPRADLAFSAEEVGK